MLAAAALVISLSAPAAAKVRIIGLPTFALPSPVHGCSSATALGAATQVPIKVSRVGTQVAETVNVCLHGKGPFPFVIDTGAASSVIDTGLARRLGLPAAGSQQGITGVGCVGSAAPKRTGTWSVAGFALRPQTISASTIPGLGGRGEPLGLLGSDVFSRFGAIRVDFAAGTLTFPGPEGPSFTSVNQVNGPGSAATPPSLLSTPSAGTAPLDVLDGPGFAVAIARVTFGSHTEPFAVDTGSSQSVVNRSTGRQIGLAPTNVLERQTTVCSTITLPLVQTGAWWLVGSPAGTASALALQPLVLCSTGLGRVDQLGFTGLLGSDQLVHFGWVVLDYRNGRLVLGDG